MIADVAPRRPIAADLLLGAERVRGAQVIKQADVLMLHHLVPDEVAPGSLETNLAFYEPRTAHGSSLSPAIHAALLARAGRFEDALAALRLAARIDLDDLTGSTAGGSIWRRWAGSGRRSPSALLVSVPGATRSTSTRVCRRSGRRSSSGFYFTASHSRSVSSTARCRSAQLRCPYESWTTPGR